MTIAQLLLNTLALAGAYALVSLGFVLVLNATGAVNFSHGDLVMVGGMASAAVAQHLALPGIVLLPLVLGGMALLGAVVAFASYVPLRKRPPESVFIATIAIGIMLQNAATLLLGPDPRAAPPLLGTGTLRLAGVALGSQGISVILVAGVLIAALYGLLAHTQLGRRSRAAAQDRDIAAAIGIPVDAMSVAMFAIGSALAGAAGLLLANAYFVTPSDGANYILKAYVAVVIGGWGSLPGAVAGAGLIAAFEVLYPSLPLVVPALGRMADAEVMFSQPTSTIMLDIVILLILVVRPSGLFGEAIRHRP